MTTQHIETLIIGAGQAGLATGYHLQRIERPFLIVDSHDRIGDNWRNQWDTLKLYSPARYDGLPGMRFPARCAAAPVRRAGRLGGLSEGEVGGLGLREFGEEKGLDTLIFIFFSLV